MASWPLDNVGRHITEWRQSSTLWRPCRVSAWLTPPSWPSPQGSPSSKRRGPLLQPIIEGETALFFDDIKVKRCCCCRCSCNQLPAALSHLPPTTPSPLMNPIPGCWLGSCLFLDTRRDTESVVDWSWWLSHVWLHFIAQVFMLIILVSCNLGLYSLKWKI